MQYHQLINSGEKPTSAGSGANSLGGSDTDEIHKLIGEFCSAGQLRNLVKAYRPNQKEYAVSVTRDELLRSVQKLFGAYHIPAKALEELLERAEENGRQHLFLYTALDDVSRNRLSDFDRVQRVLLNGRTRDQAGLPKFQIHPRGIAEADLRQEKREGSTYSSWLFKLYGGSDRWVQCSSKITGDEKVVKYKLEYRREVFVVKWHSFGLLEIRIPTGNSRAQLTEARDALLRSVGAIISADEVLESLSAELAEKLSSVVSVGRRSKPANENDIAPSLGLRPLKLPLSRLDADARDPKIKWIQVNDSLLVYFGTKVRVLAHEESENAYGNPAVVTLFKPVTDCEEVRAVLHLAEQADSVQKISVEFGTSFSNEIRIGPQTTPEAVEFICRRVWERASSEPLPTSSVDDFTLAAHDNATISTPDLESLSQRFPYLVNAFKGLHEWLVENPAVEYLDPDRLRRTATAGVPAEDFAVALATLVEEGVLSRKYRIQPAPGRRFIAETFDSFEAILKADLKDSSGEAINLDHAKVVAVFGKGKG